MLDIQKLASDFAHAIVAVGCPSSDGRYRFVMLTDGATAYEVEEAIKSGEWAHGRPLLNPGK
jgi:hypothetical protein